VARCAGRTEAARPRRHRIVHEASRQVLAGAVVHYPLTQHAADAHRHRAMCCPR